MQDFTTIHISYGLLAWPQLQPDGNQSAFVETVFEVVPFEAHPLDVHDQASREIDTPRFGRLVGNRRVKMLNPMDVPAMLPAIRKTVYLSGASGKSGILRAWP